MKKCYVLLADGFEEIEALCPVDLLRRAGCRVETVAVANRNPVIGAHGITVMADRLADGIEASFDLVLLPGGMPGSKNLDQSHLVDALLKVATESDAVIAAICAAPFVLGKRGLLAGKKATCYPGFEKDLQGAEVVDCGVVVDGNIVTASDMGLAEEFGLALVEKLCGKEAAETVRASVHPRPNRKVEV